MSNANVQRGRGGFTLIEILVSLVLLAILSAAVFPVITQQIESADPSRAASDLASIRTGIETFNLNVKSRYPGDLEDLAAVITATDTRVDGNPFVAKDVARWKGPYFDGSIVDEGTVVTGFEGAIQDQLVRYDINADAPEFGTGFTLTNQLFVAVQVRNLEESEFEAINDVIDGTGEPDGATGSQALGKFRRNDKATSGTFVNYYLATPIVP